VAASTNVPGARWEAVNWFDPAGNFWLLGGNGFDSAGTYGSLNDLWKFSAGEWTWVSGSSSANAAGNYGILGTSAPTNVPGARALANGWTDGDGNLWLFGGSSNFVSAAFNDLWKFSAGEWTWMSGSNLAGQSGLYGVLGVAASTDVPGARLAAVGWTDAAHNFWLFGGEGFGSASSGALNDLWRYSAGEWTWMGGTNLNDQPGIYGTEGTAATTNLPGARWAAAGWIDPNGNFWIFGGNGDDSNDTYGELNDLWEYQQ
jgi:hypothetical protein